MAKSEKKMTKLYREKHKMGQFFTCDELVEILYKSFSIEFNNKKILEPSCGDCAFIKNINADSCSIVAYDVDKNIISSNMKKYPNIEFVCNDFLKQKFDKKFDLIVGNPPFNLPTPYFYDTTEGFLSKCIDLLEENGDLLLVLPATVLRNKPYENIRRKILENQIVSIMNTFEYDFLGADIETIVLHLKKKQVFSQKYFYINGDSKIKVEWNPNPRYTINLDNCNYANHISSNCLSNVKIDDIFNVYRGRGKENIILRGRDINFYGSYIDGHNKKLYIGIQNVAYRLTANVIKGDEKEISDTITLLVPKQDMDFSDLIYYSEYLNSSIANYILHTTVLNNNRLTIHMDKYFIKDLYLPNLSAKLAIIDNIIKNEYTELLSINRNEIFEKMFIDDNGIIEAINKYTTFPKFKNKCEYINPLRED